jgi:hypothetical protein
MTKRATREGRPFLILSSLRTPVDGFAVASTNSYDQPSLRVHPAALPSAPLRRPNMGPCKQFR